MLDFILGLALAALAVRGWARGFVREILDLIGLVVGLWIAFRLGGPFGDFLTSSFGVSPEVARVGAGIALFVLFGAALSVGAHYLSKMMSLPGLNMVNRVGGSAVALAWGVALILVIVNIARVLPIPESWQEEIEDSTVVTAIAGPGAFPQQVFETIAGDSLLSVLATLQDLFGVARVVPEPQEIVEIPPAQPDEIRQVREDVEDVVEALNELRAGAGVSPLAPSDALTSVAEQRAVSMYTGGSLFRTDCRLEAEDVGVRVSECVDTVALATSALAGLEGIKDSDSGLESLQHSGFDRTGVAVVEGPTGSLLVIVLAG